MAKFEPEFGNTQIKLIEAYDAMRLFLMRFYSSYANDESTGEIAGVIFDLDRETVPGGHPIDEATWQSFLEACQEVQSRGKDSNV